MELSPAAPQDVPALAQVLVDCVEGGASVGFLAGVTGEQAAAYWAQALQDAQTWVARLDGRVVGCVQLRPASMPNGRHRAEVGKLLVHRHARGRGVASALMAHLEQAAREQGRWLLLLDTETGSAAQALYERLGWQPVGVVPEHALQPDGRPAPTTFLFKRLAASPGGP